LVSFWFGLYRFLLAAKCQGKKDHHRKPDQNKSQGQNEKQTQSKTQSPGQNRKKRKRKNRRSGRTLNPNMSRQNFLNMKRELQKNTLPVVTSDNNTGFTTDWTLTDNYIEQLRAKQRMGLVLSDIERADLYLHERDNRASAVMQAQQPAPYVQDNQAQPLPAATAGRMLFALGAVSAGGGIVAIALAAVKSALLWVSANGAIIAGIGIVVFVGVMLLSYLMQPKQKETEIVNPTEKPSVYVNVTVEVK
jgi:hypothetical protein